ncbi:MAG: DUF4384 domain-containing protein [Acidobacteriota bacterium]
MKNIRISLTLLMIALISLAAFAQKKPAPASSKTGDRTRGLFLKKRADAMRILILKMEESQLVPVAPNHEFKEGDEIKVQFESNFDGFIYLINVTPGGKRLILYPNAELTDNVVRTNQRYDFPPGGNVIQFDPEKGTEVIQVIMSRERIAYLDEAIKNGGDLGESAAGAAAEIQAGLATDNVTKVIPEDKGVRTRDIKFAAGKDKDQEGSFVAISDNKGKLGKGDVGVYEIRLKHN